MDETAQSNSPEPASAQQGFGGHTAGQSTPENPDARWAPPRADEGGAAVVPLWRDPPTGSISGRASVNGSSNVLPINGGNGSARLNGVRRGRLDGRPPYADLLTPVHPTSGHPLPLQAVPVSPASPPPPSAPPAPSSPPFAPPAPGSPDAQTTLAGQQPALPAYPGYPTTPPTYPTSPPNPVPAGEQPNVLHYGHYPPGGQGWPSSPDRPTDQPRPADLPPGYQPMPQYPTAGQPGYPATDPTSAEAADAFVPAPALPSYPPSSIYPPSPRFSQASSYGPAPASAAPAQPAPSAPAPVRAGTARQAGAGAGLSQPDDVRGSHAPVRPAASAPGADDRLDDADLSVAAGPVRRADQRHPGPGHGTPGAAEGDAGFSGVRVGSRLLC